MLHLAQKIAGTTVSGTDGEIGTLEIPETLHALIEPFVEPGPATDG